MKTSLKSPLGVLLVEDNPNDARLIRRHLTESDSSLLPDSVNFHHAESLDAGVTILADTAIDLLLLDLGLPGSEGTDTYERAQKRIPGVPVVVLTNLDDDEAAVELLNRGAQDYLNKGSLDERNLIKAVRYAVERRERRNELERNREFLKQTQEVAAIGGWEIDFQQGTQQWTDEVYRIHGLSLETELTVEDGIEFYHPDDRDTIREAFERLTTEGEPYDLELRIVRADGEIRWVRTLGDPLYEDGEIVGAHGTVQDVTERKEREQELQTLSEQLEVLNRILRHDIRNDTQTVQLWTERLQTELSEEHQDTLRRIQQTNEHIQELTENSRALIRALTHGELETEPVRLKEIVENELERARLRYPDAEFSVDGSLSEAVVSADGALSSVVRNLLNNAVQHNRGEVAVTVRVEQNDDFLRLCILDNGPGVPDGQKKKVFGKGERGMESNGTGIGLYLVKELTQNYNGTVWVEDSEDYQHGKNHENSDGAVFVVELPTATGWT
jgi:PAS domain S-box-containing protein